MVVELVAGRERGLEGLTLSIARVLDQEEAHACSPAEVALVVAKGDRDADHSIHVVDLDVRCHVVERREFELGVQLRRFIEGHRRAASRCAHESRVNPRVEARRAEREPRVVVIE